MGKSMYIGTYNPYFSLDNDIHSYLKHDVSTVNETATDKLYRALFEGKFKFERKPEEIKMKIIINIEKVIFNPPATIVIWKDGTKTVVKCAEGDEYNHSAGIALCVMKKVCGDSFHENLKRFVKMGVEDEERRERKLCLDAKQAE